MQENAPLDDDRDHHGSHPLLMTVGAIGVVYGDLGTSPLYTFQQTMQTQGLPASTESIFGCISLVFWALLMVVTVKYIWVIMRASNDGEGGIFALIGLLRARPIGSTRAMILATTSIGIAAAALLFADTLITPALSVMSAVEGIEIMYPDADHWVVGISAVILLMLFLLQQFGTAIISRLFSPVMLVYFCTIAVLGSLQIWQTPTVWAALSPHFAGHLLIELSWGERFALLGNILLALTGAEALYADMGHFGRRPIARAWTFFVLPSVMLNYLGQGAWMVRTQHFSTANSPFFLMAPDGWLWPIILLSVFACVIASQAVITGTFSMASQAIKLHYLPRLKIEHTSAVERGQIYLPRINFLLTIGCILLVLTFRSASALAAAFGFAVAATMIVTTIVFLPVMHYVWHWPVRRILIIGLCAAPLDFVFFAAASTKLPESHSLTLIIAIVVAFLLVVWQVGNRYLTALAQRLDMPVSLFADMISDRTDLHFQQRPALFFQNLPPQPGGEEITPNALLRQVQLTSMLYQPTVIVDFNTTNAPRVREELRVKAMGYPNRIHVVTLSFGFAEEPSLAPVLEYGRGQGWWGKKEEELVYYLGREDLRFAERAEGKGLPGFVKWPFAWLHRQDESLARTLQIPATQYAELSITIDI